MTPTDALQTAIAWHLRLPEADEAQWLVFLTWLEADPAHAAAYDEVSVADRLLLPETSSAPSANDNEAPPRGRWRFAMVGAAAAAALGIVFSWPLIRSRQPYKYAVFASSDEYKTIAIGSNDRARLEPGAQVGLDRSDPRHASLEHGRARFEIRHDPVHPFRLELGNHALIDTGTVFTASLNGSGIVVAVEEGGVIFDPGAAAVAIKPGQRLEFDLVSNTGQLSAASAKPTAGAAAAAMAFDDAPLSVVTAAVERASGARIVLEKGLAGRRFTGVFRVTGIAERDVPHLAEATGMVSRRDDDHWVLAPLRSNPD